MNIKSYQNIYKRIIVTSLKCKYQRSYRRKHQNTFLLVEDYTVSSPVIASYNDPVTI